MTIPQGYDEREARRTFVRNRQKLVFSIAITTLVVATVLSLLTFYGVIGWSKRNVKSLPNYGVTAPCLPAQYNGADYDGTRIDASQISVRVLNGTNQRGLAGAVRDELKIRKYNTATVDNLGRSIERTTIYFGKDAIPEAYTLGSLFTDAILQMDARGNDGSGNKSIDVVIGSTFKNLKDRDDPSTTADSKLANIEGCVAADQMTDVPATLELTKASDEQSGDGDAASTAQPSSSAQ
ncbi:LytR cell envelope-related transcriptional attenuator [Bifidobacterium sp. DSM 109958]|uniref:LytR cell envelope-related transcriptional attenuator n=1 Tax=Bifidobacterium moraviense TaxID=2675323 RepID=A0A7Y0F2V0_9BIFI|nr:LytR C-terminal domain-containing protein [Bifidobacterium sp. DSM 109958]NMN01025.1 LytR cell envelope-related transcriptional attenuator [Bifidobacterium sp. DSM 109958]